MPPLLKQQQLDLIGRETIAVTASRNIAVTDINTCLLIDSASAVTLTFISDTFPIGAEIDVIRDGTGDVSLVAGTGVTLNRKADPTTHSLAARYSACVCKYVGIDRWILIGDFS